MAHLDLLRGSQRRRLELIHDRTFLGRAEGNDIVLPWSDVSRRHARIDREALGYVVEDLGSKHGTALNGRALKEPALLRDGDEIRIGGCLLSFRAQPSPAGASTAPEHGSAEQPSSILLTLDAGRSPAAVAAAAGAAVGPEARLRAVLEILDGLSGAARVDEFLDKLLEILLRVFAQAERGLVLLRRSGAIGAVPRDASELELRAWRGPGAQRESEPPRFSWTIVRRAMEGRQAILSADAWSDTAILPSDSISDQRIRSLICAPLLASDGAAFGVLQLHSEQRGPLFAEQDLALLVSVVRVAALLVENLRLQEGLRAGERLARDLELAHDVQRRFLPAAPPQVEGYEFAAWYQPARSVGGDYYDFIALPDARLGIAIGDVSGKGVAAALWMARLSGDVRVAMMREGCPGRALSVLNRTLLEGGHEGRFVTLLLMALDPRRHELRIANAGHLPPLLRRAGGRVESLGAATAGLPLMAGFDAAPPYEAIDVPLGHSELVLACTDGIMDSANAAGELFGAERLAALLARSPPGAGELAELVVASTRRFAAGAAARDDATLVVIGRGPDRGGRPAPPGGVSS